MSTLLSEESGGHSLDPLNLGCGKGTEHIYLIKVWSPQFSLRNKLYEGVSPTMNCLQDLERGTTVPGESAMNCLRLQLG